MRDIFIETLSDLVEKHPEIILITGDLGFGVFNDFIKKYPNNFFNAGVAEQTDNGVRWRSNPTTHSHTTHT